MVFNRERNEHTIAEQVTVSGRGYWSGLGVNVRFVPAAAGTGICFVRSDLPSQPEIKACVQNRIDSSLRTTIQVGDARVEMIEHVMAALYGLEIDNCVVFVDQMELPGLDGSSASYVHALRTAGLVMQAKTRERLVVTHPVRVGTSDGWLEATPSNDGGFSAEYRLDYGPTSPIQPQTYSCCVTPDSFGRQVGAARTFVTAEQAKALHDSGVAPHVTNRDLLVFGPNGPIDNLLRYPDECARHKLLDLIGDISIVGAEIVGKIVSYRGGHQLNGLMAETLCKHAESMTARCRNAA